MNPKKGTGSMNLWIKIIATTSFAIIAVVAVLAVVGYIVLATDILLNLALKIAILVIFGGIIIAVSKSKMDDLLKFILILIMVLLMIASLLWVNI